MTAAPGTAPPPRGLVANTAALAASRVVVAALGWTGTVLIVRRLSAEDWGRFSLVFGLLGLLAFLTDLGSSRVVLRTLREPGVDPASFLGTYVVLRGVLGAAAVAAALGYVWLGGYDDQVVRATALGGVVVLVSAPSGGLDAVFQSQLRLFPVAAAQVAGQLAQLALTVLVALTRPGLLLFVLPAIAFDVVVAGWKLRQVRRVVRLRYSVDLRTWGRILRQAAPVALGGALATLYAKVDLVLLSRLDTLDSVGQYGVALKFVVLAAFLPTALTLPLLPMLVHAWPDDLETFRRTVQRALVLMSVAAGLVLVGFLPVAPELISLLYGEQYAPAATASRLAVGAECYGYLLLVAVTVLIAVGRNRTYVVAGLVGLVVNVVANLLLVPRYSYEGAALASALTGVGLTVVVGTAAAQLPGLRPFPLARTGAVLAVAAVAVAIGWVGAGPLPWPLACAAGLVSYVVLLEVTGAVGPGGLRALVRDAGPA